MTDPTAMLLQAGLLLVLLSCSAFFSGAETALFSLGRARLLQYADDPRPERRRIALLMRSYNRTLIALVGGNMLVNTGLSMISAELLGSLSLPPLAAMVVSVTLALVVLLVFGEITPKAVSLQFAERLALLVSGPVWWWNRLMSPVITAVEKVSARLLDLLGRRHSPPLRPEEYGEYVELSYSIGAFSDEEAELLKHVFMLRQRRVGRLMTPRVDIPCVPRRLDATAVAERLREHRRLFLPVIDESIDDVEGVLSASGFFALPPAARAQWAGSAAVTPACFVPENARLTMAMAAMQAQGVEVAMVADEYGGVVGMLERKAIFEDIVGEMDREYQQPVWQIRREGSETWRINGQIPLEELRELLPGLPLAGVEANTLNGLFAQRLDRMPVAGDRVVMSGVELTALSVEGNRIVEAELNWPGGGAGGGAL